MGRQLQAFLPPGDKAHGLTGTSLTIVADPENIIVVDPSDPAANDNGPGTPDEPLVTIQAANALVDPADRYQVKIYSGTYKNTVNLGSIIAPSRSGTAANTVSYTFASGATVNLTGLGTGNSRVGWPIDFLGRSYCSVNGSGATVLIDGDDWWDAALVKQIMRFVDCDNCAVSNVDSQYSYGWGGILFDNCDLNTLSNVNAINHGTLEIQAGESGIEGQDTGNMVEVASGADRTRIWNCAFRRGGHDLLEDRGTRTHLWRVKCDNDWNGHKGFGVGRGNRAAALDHGDRSIYEQVFLRGGGEAESGENAAEVPTIKFTGDQSTLRNAVMIRNPSGEMIRSNLNSGPQNTFYQMSAYGITAYSAGRAFWGAISEATAPASPTASDNEGFLNATRDMHNGGEGSIQDTNYYLNYWLPEAPQIPVDYLRFGESDVAQSASDFFAHYRSSGGGSKIRTLAVAQSERPQNYGSHNELSPNAAMEFPSDAQSPARESEDIDDWIPTSGSPSARLTWSRGVAQATNSGASSTALIVDYPARFYDGMGWTDGPTPDLLWINGQATRITLNTINHSTGAITLDTAATWSIGDWIFLDEMRANTSPETSTSGCWGTGA